MRRPVVGTLFALAACLIYLPAQAMSTPEIGQKGNGWSIVDERALHVYEDCWDAFKARCGRNIVDDGLASGEQPSDRRVKQWTATMERWLSPPEPPAVDSPVVVAEAPVASSVPVASDGACGGTTPYSGGGQCWAIPYEIVLCESGGSYTAYNPSGASGAYQLMVGGTGSPAEQDAAAAELWAGGAGRSNWVC